MATVEDQPKGRMIKLDLTYGTGDYSLICPIVLFKDENFPDWGGKPRIFALETGSVGCRSSGTIYIVLSKTGSKDEDISKDVFR